MIMQKEIDRYLLLFGEVIKRERINKGLTQYALAERSSLSRNYISKVERGERNVSIATLFSIAMALNLELSDIFMAVDRQMNH